MATMIAPSLAHLHRLTDARGLRQLPRSDRDGCCDESDTIIHADALRLCAAASDTVDAEEIAQLAEVYFGHLERRWRESHSTYDEAAARGRGHSDDDGALERSRIARALAAVMTSALPDALRRSASASWEELWAGVDHIRSARAAGHWLIALGELGMHLPSSPLGKGGKRGVPMSSTIGKSEALSARHLADWLIEDCHYAIRSSAWEWFEPRWTPGAACIPHGLWAACELLDNARIRRVARITTRFIMDHLFEDGLYLPVGTRGGWHPHASRAIFDQRPAEACSVVELLCAAERIDRRREYGQYARFAAQWFSGNNVKGIGLIDPETGGCHDAITPRGLAEGQGPAAIVSSLLTHAALAGRSVVIEAAPIYAMGTR